MPGSSVDDARIPTPTCSIRFDLRIPPWSSTTFAAQHAAMLDMAAWADRLGFHTLGLAEHHGDPAGYMPAPLTLASAALVRTRRIRIRVGALLAPLHDFVRLAEQLAVIECLCPGRMSVVLGAGYRESEFEMAGVDRPARGRLVEECFGVLHSAWTGEPFEWRDRQILVTPPPPNGAGPEVVIGGQSKAAARRAARLGTGLFPAVADSTVIGEYFDECARLGHERPDVFGHPSLESYLAGQPGSGHRVIPSFVMVSRDPERTWRTIGPNAVFDATTYASWQDDRSLPDWAVSGAGSWEELRESGRYAVVTPDEAVDLARRNGRINFHPLMGGIHPELAWESLELFESEVLPQLTGSVSGVG